VSFSSQLKGELCRTAVGERSCAVAEACGVLLYCNAFTAEEIRIVTASGEFAARLPKLFKRAFGVSFDEVPDNEGGRMIFRISDPAKLLQVADVCGYDRDRHHAHHVNFGVLDEEGCKQAFLRGAFLAGGSVTEPSRSYHLELVTDHYHVSREVCAVLQEMDFEPGSANRNGRYITYFKNSEVIEDFLTSIGAPVAAMEIMSEKISKSMRNSVNRLINCDEANSDKTVAAAEKQLAAIHALTDIGILETLPEKLRQTAQLRLENPELSLSQLAELCTPPVSKSCLSHRLHRLEMLAGEGSARKEAQEA